jgi:alkylated DNA repair dioxygenase AlkB
MKTNLLEPVTSAVPGALPGLLYQPNFVSEAEAQEIQRTLETLPFERFKFRQYLGNRRVCAFGYRYDFTRRALAPAPPLPTFLDDLRDRVAQFAHLRREDIAQEQVLEYAPGAGIGWHRDKPEFDIVVGVSLGAPAVMRFRQRDGDKWIRASQNLESRSIYIMSGIARHEWEHSIVPQTDIRYSLIFRSLTTTAATDSGPRANRETLNDSLAAFHQSAE